MRTLIRNAICVIGNESLKTHLLFDESQILTCDAAKSTSADERIEANGFHLIPGIIDDQVHFRDPGLTHKEDLFSGSCACAKGGVTTYLEMPNTIPTTTTNTALLEKLKNASSKSVVNYGFFMGATNDNLEELKQSERTPGIKIFFGSSTGDLLVEDMKILERIFTETSLPIAGHCEEESVIKENLEKFKKEIKENKNPSIHSKIRDRNAAIFCTEKITTLAKKTGKKIHILHLSTKEEIEIIKNHEGLITAEACIPHLMFTEEDYPRLKTLIQTNPSIKKRADKEALFKALKDNSIQVIATDHAPHLIEEKTKPYPKSSSGIPSIENSLALMLNEVNKGNFHLSTIVEKMSTNPARVWNMLKKGEIKKGYDSDLVLIDLNKEKTIRNSEQQTKSGWSPWDGEKITGWPETVWVHGRKVFSKDKINHSRKGKEVLFDKELKGFWG